MKTKHFVAVLFSAMMILPSLASGQDSIPDSTVLVAMPRWMHWRAQREIEIGRSCDSLRQQLEKELTKANTVIVKDSLVIQANAEQIGHLKAEVQIQTERLDNRREHVDALRKEKRSGKLIAVASGGAAVIVAAFGGPVAVVALCAAFPGAYALWPRH